jgi:hypothetical protein
MSTIIPLGSFERVTLTQACPTEDRNFTPWHAEEDSFFAIEIELWRICTSLPAPRFNVIASRTRRRRKPARANKEHYCFSSPNVGTAVSKTSG